MRVVQIIENTASNEGLEAEHGLSTYIETEGYKILFDMGKSDAFVRNAEVLGVDLKEVDLAILSHGHYDHGGGIEAFLKINAKAKIYMSRYAFEAHYSDRADGSMKYIGIDQAFKDHPRIEFVDDWHQLTDGLVLFSNQSTYYEQPPMNRYLYMEHNGLEKDDFHHEINLSIKTDEGYVMVAGCAHQGILNIANTHRNRFGEWPKTVIGGFHLSSGSRKEVTGSEYLDRFAKDLKATPSTYYTCHCTGVEAYEMLKPSMGDRLAYFAGGMEIDA